MKNKLCVLAVAMLFASALHAELTLNLGDGGMAGEPITVTISDVGGLPASDDAGTAVSGSLNGVSGTLVFEAAAAHLASEGNWEVIGNDLQIHTQTDVAKSAAGWGAVRGGLRADRGGQLIAFTFDLSGLNLPPNTTLRITGFTTDVAASPDYIVEGVSRENLTSGTLFSVHTPLESGQQIGWSGNGAGAGYKLASISIDTDMPAPASPPSQGSLKGSRPNIIFFLGDDQNITDQSAYGNNNVPTPTTQALAEGGLIFDRMFTGQAICAPSRSMLYTGLYPLRNGCFINHRPVRSGIQTLPDYLQPLGYNVILAGKSHVGPAEQFAWTQEWGSLAPTEGRPHGWIPIGQIEDFLADPGPNPFCMMITSHYPHPKWITDKPYTLNGKTILPGSPEYKPYHASIAEKEAELAAVLDAVEANGLSENTIIFFSDDHGNSGKFTCYDRGLNVAFIVRWPGNIQPGRTDALTSFTDFVPTAIELAGGTAPATLDGKSLIPLLEGEGAVLHEAVYGVTVNQGIIKRKIFPQRSIHDGRYHYIWNFNSLERIKREDITDYFHVHGAEWYSDRPEEELYDTLSDPSESINLADQPEFATRRAKMKERLFSWMEDQSDYLKENQSSPFLYVPKSRYHLDQDAPGDPVPTELKGTLDGLMVDPHEITDPSRS